MAQFDNVSVKKKANIYFDGKCVSHTILLPNGTRSTIGVIFPSSLTFNTQAAEVMEILAGHCRVKLKGASDWSEYKEDQKLDRKSTRLNSSHPSRSRMPSSA